MRSVRIFHRDIEQPLTLRIMLPFGYMYNRELLTLRPGDTMELYNDSYDYYQSYEILFMRKVRFDSLEFKQELILAYGKSVTLQSVFKRWCNYAIMNGHEKESISREECLLFILRRCI